MNSSPVIKILLPAYNEAEALPRLIKRIDEVKINSGLDLRIFVVNDGSKDSTLEVANKTESVCPKEVLDLQPNRGLAGAMREGLKKAIEGMQDDDILVTMDADDSHHPDHIVQMNELLKNGSDLIIASRFQKGAEIVGLSGFRKITGSAAAIIFRMFVRIRGVKDYTCGYRAIRVKFLRMAMENFKDDFIVEQGFACTAEILLKIAQFKPVINEVPLILRYDLKPGASKMNVFKTILRTFSIVFNYRFSRKFRPPNN